MQNSLSTRATNIFYYSLPVVLILFSLWYHFYDNNSIILGGEGNFFIDFARHSDVYGSTWFDVGYGWPNVIPNAVGINHYILIAISDLTNSYRFVNFSLVLFMYIAPYVTFLLLAKYLNVRRNTAIIIAFLYAIGPFSINYLQALNQWNVFSIAIIPLLYYMVLKYSNSTFKLFISVGLVTRLLSFSFYNPPTAIIILSVVLIAGLHQILSRTDAKSKNLTEYIKLVFIAYFGFLIFNLDWLSVLFYSIKNNIIVDIFSPEYALTWAESVSSQSGLLFKSLTHGQMITSNTILDAYYQHTLSIVLLYIFTGLIVIKSAMSNNIVLKYLSFLVIITIFLTKGISNPLGDIYIYLMKNVPYFYIFKTPTEKFGILLNFLIFISLAILISNRREVFLKALTWILATFCIIPILFMDGLAASSDDGNYVMSRKQEFNEYDLRVINHLTSNYYNMRILSLPGGLNYQVMIDSKYGVYTGLDPILNNAHVSYIHPSLDRSVYKNIFSIEWLQRLQEKDISAVVYNTKEIPWFGKSINVGLNVLSRRLKEMGMKETIIGNYYIWHVPNSGNRVSFERY